MARFNPQAFLSGMQSLMAPQQQADQQVAQMRMQQMDRAREQESALNQRSLQGEQLKIQRDESVRAGERFGLEKEAAGRQKESDERNKKITDLQIDTNKTEAARAFTAPITKARGALTAARTAYNNAKARPLNMTRADYLKITNDVLKAQSDYDEALSEGKTLLKYASPTYGFNDTLFGESITPITPMTFNEAAKAFKDLQSGVKVVPNVTPTDTKVVPTQSGAINNNTSESLANPKPNINPVAAGGTNQLPNVDNASSMSPRNIATQNSIGPQAVNPFAINNIMSLANLGVGQPITAGIEPVKPPSTTSPTMAAPRVGMPQRKPRIRVYKETDNMILASDEEAKAQEIATDYSTYINSTFNGNPTDQDFNEKYYQYVADPDVFKNFTSKYNRGLSIMYPESELSILASAESTILGQLGNKTKAPTALRAGLTDVAIKTEGLKDARSEAEFKKTLRPLTIDEMTAKIKYYNNGGSRSNQIQNPYKGVAGRVSVSTKYGRSEIIELDKLIKDNTDAIRVTKDKDPKAWRRYMTIPASNTYKQQQIVDEAVQLRAKIMTQQDVLRTLVSDESKFYNAFVSMNPLKAIRNKEIAMKLRAGVGSDYGDNIENNYETPTNSPAGGIDEPPGGF